MTSQCVDQAESPCSASERDANAVFETCEPSNVNQGSPRDAILTADYPPPHEIDFENIPGDLISLDRWVNWDFRRNRQNAKWTKVPQHPNGGSASITDPETCHDYATVVAAANENGRGIGFVFTGDGIVGIDIDDCRDPQTGRIQPWALEIIRIMATYTEISPSQTGVKLFVRGHLPESFRKKHPRPEGLGAVEIFTTGRYFTVTGQRLVGTPAEVHYRPQELLTVYQLVSEWNQPKAEALPLLVLPPSSPLLTADRATALAAIAVLSPDMGYDDWLKTGMALHAADSSEAMLAGWESWSRGSAKFVEGECRSKWDSFGGGDVGVGTLCLMADETGQTWRPPIPAQGSTTDAKLQATIALRKALRELERGHPPGEVIDSVACSMNALSASQAKPALETLTSQELADGQYHQRYLIPGLLVRGEPCILAGAKKCLKTNALIDLTLSLSEGGQFLNHFDVATSIRVALISGESGKGTIQETARRIARTKGWKKLADYKNAFWCFDLPRLGAAGTVETLVEYIRTHKLELLIIDPAYLCMPLGDSAGNLFVVGNMLADLSKVIAQTGCTIILCHHTRKLKDTFAPLELDSIAWSGFAEWARQWLLLGRRAPFDPDSNGHHELWLSAGGSAGHSGVWAVDIHEGRPEDSGGRRWRVTVTTATKSKAEKDRERNQKQTDQVNQAGELNLQRVLEAYQRYPGGETRTTVRNTAGLSGGKFNEINAELLEEGLVESCVVVKGNKRHKGYRLTCSGTAGLSGTAEESPSCPSE